VPSRETFFSAKSGDLILVRLRLTAKQKNLSSALRLCVKHERKSVCSAVRSIRDVCEMIVDIDLLPGAESMDKDRYTYPTVILNFLPLRLCFFA
jgi:hypothetical protein